MPLYEYIPDGEPHVFNERLYIYGSHHKFGAFSFCRNDYVAYSPPIDDLNDWRYEGIILKRDEDPENKNYITQYGKDDDLVETQYIKDGCLIGYKHFNLEPTITISLKVKGKAEGDVLILFDEFGEANNVVHFKINDYENECFLELRISKNSCKTPLFFKFTNLKGKLDFYSFELK